jgi:hypothetical protein
MKENSVTNDFIYYSLVKNDINKVPMTLDNVITILPHVCGLIVAKYDSFVKNGIRAAWNILKCFSDVKKKIFKIIENYFCEKCGPF